MQTRDGSEGWDEYAPFYDWENARTVARRDVRFWERLAAAQGGPVLELGCGTGRLSLPLAKAGVRLVGIDRSAPMLGRDGRLPEGDAKRRSVEAMFDRLAPRYERMNRVISLGLDTRWREAAVVALGLARTSSVLACSRARLAAWATTANLLSSSCQLVLPTTRGQK